MDSEATFQDIDTHDSTSTVPPTSQTSRVVALAGLTAASTTVTDPDISDAAAAAAAKGSSASTAAMGADFDDSSSSINGHASPSLGSVASLLALRRGAGSNHGLGGAGHGTSGADAHSVPSITDVKKFLFQSARSDKRLLGGLKAHTFTSQAFISSFAVGLAIGSVMAILLRIMTEIGYRTLPFFGK